jgi:hypothetical protein
MTAHQQALPAAGEKQNGAPLAGGRSATLEMLQALRCEAYTSAGFLRTSGRPSGQRRTLYVVGRAGNVLKVPERGREALLSGLHLRIFLPGSRLLKEPESGAIQRRTRGASSPSVLSGFSRAKRPDRVFMLRLLPSVPGCHNQPYLVMFAASAKSGPAGQRELALLGLRPGGL